MQIKDLHKILSNKKIQSGKAFVSTITPFYTLFMCFYFVPSFSFQNENAYTVLKTKRNEMENCNQ